MDPAHTWHPGEVSVEPAWTVPIRFFPDETISSWLVRVALAHRCSPEELAQWIWPSRRAWTADIDRGVLEGRLRSLEQCAGIRADTFQKAALAPIARRIEGKAPNPKSAWRWILTRGPVTARRQGTAQYCPECLSTDCVPHYRLPWRFAWHIACPRHHTELVDRCSECSSAILFYRLGQRAPHVALCALCGADLRRSERSTCNREALLFQNMADRAALNGHATCFGKEFGTTDWFSVASFFVALLRRAASHPSKAMNEVLQGLGVEPPSAVPPVSGARIERLQTRDRQEILERVWRIMSRNADQFRDAVEQSRISRQGWCGKRREIPESVARILPELPENRRARYTVRPQPRRGPRGRSEVLRMMRRLERAIAHERR